MKKCLIFGSTITRALKDGAILSVFLNIHGALHAIGLALQMLFFVVAVYKLAVVLQM